MQPTDFAAITRGPDRDVDLVRAALAIGNLVDPSLDDDVARSTLETLAAHARERHNPLVLAVPRGGLTVAEPIADALGLPLDVWVTGQGRRFGGPGPRLPLSGALPRCAADGPVSRQRRRVGRDVATGAVRAVGVQGSRGRQNTSRRVPWPEV